MRRASDRLRRLNHCSSDSNYLSAFRNITLTIRDMKDGEKFDRFRDGLKGDVRLEVMKSLAITFDDAARMDMRIDSVLLRAGYPFNSHPENPSSSSTSIPNSYPMEI